MAYTLRIPSKLSYWAKRLTRRREAVEVRLLVYEESLLDCSSRRHSLLAETDASTHIIDAARLAEAARWLLPDTEVQQGIALALPPHEFMATPVNLPGVAAENLYNAVRLQLPMLLPGSEQRLLLAVQATPGSSRHLALWLPEARAEALFQAFQQRGLLLSALLPRPCLAFSGGGGLERIYDEDQTTVTYLEFRQGVLQQWLYVPKADWEFAEFRQQFEQAAGETVDAPDLARRDSLHAWETQGLNPAVNLYRLVPPSALALTLRQRRQRRWQRLKYAGLGVTALALLVLGGVGWTYHRLEARLEALKQQTTDVTQLRSEIFAIEEKLGPVLRFPRQDSVALLQRLNGLIPKDSWISGFKLKEGNLELEGSSPNPAALLELLTAQAEFAEVAFNRPTQGDRFGIRLHLVGVDVPAYVAEFFPNSSR